MRYFDWNKLPKKSRIWFVNQNVRDLNTLLKRYMWSQGTLRPFLLAAPGIGEKTASLIETKMRTEVIVEKESKFRLELFCMHHHQLFATLRGHPCRAILKTFRGWERGDIFYIEINLDEWRRLGSHPEVKTIYNSYFAYGENARLYPWDDQSIITITAIDLKYPR